VAGFIGETNLLQARVVKRHAGGVDLLTPLGTLTSTALPAEPIAEGAAVTLSIRPESVALGGDGAAANAFTAVVRDSVYLGEIAQHQIDAGPAAGGGTSGEGAALKVFELNPRFAGRADPPRRTTARVDPGDVVVLAR
jgi:ABC-type Fe3+/spermidine/putrescine transport system ATPase subunit